jgi:hypothetical protein
MINEQILKETFIGIPSLSRPEYITKKTMAWAKHFPNVKVFVEPQEKFLYKHYIGKAVEVLPESKRGLMYSLNYIRQYARERGYKYVFQLDDDVDGFVRIDTEDPVEAFKLTIEDCYNSMEKFPAIGGIRFTQYRFWVYSKKNISKWTHFNRPLQGIAMIRLDAINEINPDMREFTDTLTSLYIWKNGYCTLNYGLSGLKVVQNANKGGCQVYDRKEDAINTINLLKNDFPNVKEKEGSSWFKVDVDISYYLEKYRYTSLNCDDERLQNHINNCKFE